MSVNSKMTAIADAIREKTGTADLLTLDQMAAEIAGIRAGGESALDYAVSISNMFASAAFPENTELTVTFGGKATPGTSTTPFNSAFYYATGLKAVKINCGVTYPSAYSMNNMFERSSLEVVDLSGIAQPLTPSAMARTFYACSKLREIIGEFDCTGNTNGTNTFIGCTALETVRFTPNTINFNLNLNSSSKLTDETVQNILDGLADVTGGTARTLTLTATVGAKLTDAQKAAASAKNWTISY